jgi:hypothetical protein
LAKARASVLITFATLYTSSSSNAAAKVMVFAKDVADEKGPPVRLNVTPGDAATPCKASLHHAYGGSPSLCAPWLILGNVLGRRLNARKGITYSTRLDSFSVMFMALTSAAARSGGEAFVSHTVLLDSGPLTQSGYWNPTTPLAAKVLASAYRESFMTLAEDRLKRERQQSITKLYEFEVRIQRSSRLIFTGLRRTPPVTTGG